MTKVFLGEVTPQDKIKERVIEVLLDDLGMSLEELKDVIEYDEEDLLYESIKDVYYGDIEEILYNLREGEFETNLTTEKWSRHYESHEVAIKTSDGTFVGWTYYYGGGKHGCPDELPWIEGAYFLECEEVKKLVTIRKFTKI